MTAPFEARVAPELREALPRTLTAALPPWPLTALEVRQLDAQLSARRGLPPPDLSRQMNLGGVPVRVHGDSSGSRAVGALIWFHGGGMIMGSAEGNAARASALARDADCVVIVPDYRLAPEHPFPAAQIDAVTVVREAVARHKDLGIAPDRIALGGVSAGGNLAASAGLCLRGEIDIRLVMLLSPMLDDRTASDDDGRPAWNSRLGRICWKAYLGENSEEDPPWTAAPARCPDLSGLAPLYLDVGELDLFLEEDLSFVTHAAQAGVETECHLVPGAFHVWDSLVPEAPQSRLAHGWRVAALQRALAPATSQ